MKKVCMFFLGICIATTVSAQAQAPAGWWRITTFQNEVAALPQEKVAAIKIPVLIGVQPGDFKDSFGTVYASGSVHQGEDIFAPRGAYVVSPTKAVVTRIDTTGAGGIAVYTANPGDETFYYAHMTAVGPTIALGAQLEPGDLIGYVGNTGDADGASPHLHFQIFSADGPINPYSRLNATFSDDERIAALNAIIDRSDNRTLAAQAIVRLYKNFLSTYVGATALAPELKTALTANVVALAPQQPAVQTESMPLPPSPSTPSASIAASTIVQNTIMQNLRIGMRNDDVKKLQQYLIGQKAGEYAQTLSTYGATGYYGVLTKLAVAELQKRAGITPTSGYCGPLTRAYIATHSVS